MMPFCLDQPLCRCQLAAPIGRFTFFSFSLVHSHCSVSFKPPLAHLRIHLMIYLWFSPPYITATMEHLSKHKSKSKRNGIADGRNGMLCPPLICAAIDMGGLARQRTTRTPTLRLGTCVLCVLPLITLIPPPPPRVSLTAPIPQTHEHRSVFATVRSPNDYLVHRLSFFIAPLFSSTARN